MFGLLRRAVVALEKIATATESIQSETRAMRDEQKRFMEISQNTDPAEKVFGFMDKLLSRNRIDKG